MISYQNVWLAGHSLGSSLALAVGREMAKRFKVRLETYFLWTAGLTAVAAADVIKTDSFDALSDWVPHLFINPADPLCSEYAGYFEHKEYMETIGEGEIVRVSTENSIRSIFSSREALHLLPSAHITLNVTAATRSKEAHGIWEKWLRFKEAHGIDQWWRRELRVKYKHYQR
ncbi:hypothetical protein SASPL_116094 [Salvia splendens]|uniref:Fungal lipase-like domain-containing protein n=1 Tax=Salvia splendens TaxID=180675 RepID=A0A8X8Y6N3_SALSN|nr:hypothetical protein SASPL_116094 [Salvia splendens]